MKISFSSGDHLKVENGNFEIMVLISNGPRILSLTCNGSDNILYVDDTGFHVDEWLMYGGHRFTVAPESEKSYYPDNARCEVYFNETTVKISAPRRPDAIQLSLEIVECDNENGFELLHILENCGVEAWTGALWAITCIPRETFVTGECPSLQVHYWPQTDPSYFIVRDKQVRIGKGDFRGKIGWHHNYGCLLASQNDRSLSIKNCDDTIMEECVDSGCNLEIFVCSNWIELETLGKRINVSPGDHAIHKQKWVITERSLAGTR